MTLCLGTKGLCGNCELPGIFFAIQMFLLCFITTAHGFMLFFVIIKQIFQQWCHSSQSSEILVCIDMIASRSCCRIVGCTSMMWVCTIMVQAPGTLGVFFLKFFSQ